MLDKYLQEIGLNEKEAAVYLALLQYDNASVIGKKTKYQAEPPERLETFVERQKVILEEHSKRLRDIIPQIKSVQREIGEKPIVQYFEGKHGIMSMNTTMFEESGEKGDVAHILYPKDVLDEVFPVSERSSLKKVRISKKIFNYVLYTSSKTDYPSDSTGERIKVDGSKYPFYCDISIFKDNVRFGILGKRISGIYIKSNDLAETLRSLFGIAFNSLRQNKKDAPSDTEVKRGS